jgi:glycosyltransferase involved in cell wall biosynthesis
VASAVGGIPEQIIDGQTGWLVSPADPHALADRLADVLANRDRARSMGQAGRLNGRRFAAGYGTEAFEEALARTSRETVG